MSFLSGSDTTEGSSVIIIAMATVVVAPVLVPNSKTTVSIFTSF